MKFLTNNLIARHVKNLVGAYKQWSENRAREAELAELLVDIPGKNENTRKRNKVIYETLFKNQQNEYDYSCQATYSHKSTKKRRAQRKQTLNIIKKALNNLQDTFDLVGVQPMSGPVNLLYTLQYRTNEGRVTLEVVSKAIEAATRKLSASWTLELAQDLRVHDIDVEAEISSALGCEVAYEISNEILGDLIKLAQSSKVFEFKESILDYGKMLAVNLNRAATDIAKETRRGCGNFVITSPMGLAHLDSTLEKSGLTFKVTENPNYYCGGVQYAGDIMNGNHTMFKVYCAALALSSLESTNEVAYLVGYKGGNGDCDCGYFFSPYQMMVNMGIQVDPQTFQPIQRFATRYGKHAVDNASAYYRLVKGTMTMPATLSVGTPETAETLATAETPTEKAD